MGFKIPQQFSIEFQILKRLFVSFLDSRYIVYTPACFFRFQRLVFWSNLCLMSWIYRIVKDFLVFRDPQGFLELLGQMTTIRNAQYFLNTNQVQAQTHLHNTLWRESGESRGLRPAKVKAKPKGLSLPNRSAGVFVNRQGRRIGGLRLQPILLLLVTFLDEMSAYALDFW